MEATASSSRGYQRFRVTESEQVRVKSSIYLGRRLLTCPADVRSRGKKSVPLERRASEEKKRERQRKIPEEGNEDFAGQEGWKGEGGREPESRPISVWSPELADGLGKPTKVVGLSLPIAERVVPLVVSNSSSEGRVEGEGGHEHGPQKGLLDGLAHEQPSSVPGGGGGDRKEAAADAGRATSFTVDEESNGRVSEIGRQASKAREALRLEDRGGDATLTETPVLVHEWRRREEAALDLHLIADSGSEVRAKRVVARNASSSADSVLVPLGRGGETCERRGACQAHRSARRSSGVPGGVSGRHHAANAARRNSNRSCRVHGRRRDRSRGKATSERHQNNQNPRDLTSDEFECSVIRLEQDPILEPVRILGCPPAEGLEISSFLEPAPNYVYHPGINVARLAGNEAACFSLYDPNNILPKSRAGSIAKILEGPNRAVKDINRKVLAMARAMTPAWSLRLLGVSCGSVVCAWGLLLILSVLGGGASHGTALGSFGLGSLSGTMEDMNSARCPWLCACTGQEVDCSHRGLTQIPGDLASLLLAEKL
ncbi:hypothetical protein WN51_05700 [Melipona quadrifasciata]|uniref:LRRNT domain-containing protein n=1 Tax=Melipona quadrifasciata TaxID=166423 RepID=A0A0M9ADE9_9HYME|nr:hypothetical protein WN51_05700 [Melipona quadrifasciata]